MLQTVGFAYRNYQIMPASEPIPMRALNRYKLYSSLLAITCIIGQLNDLDQRRPTLLGCCTFDYFLFSALFGALRPDFTAKLEHGLAFGTPKVYIAPYDKINHVHVLVNLSCNCDVKSGLSDNAFP